MQGHRHVIQQCRKPLPSANKIRDIHDKLPLIIQITKTLGHNKKGFI